MELHLQSAPPAFAASCRALSALPRARLAALARRRAALGAHGAGAGADADEEGADAARAVDFVLRGAAAPAPSGSSPRAGAPAAAAPAAAALDAKALALALSRFTDLSRPAVEALVEGAAAGAAAAAAGAAAAAAAATAATATAAAGGAGAAAEEAAPLELGAAGAELVGTDWALGVTVASSNSAAVQRPFVSLQLRLRRADGALDSESVELSLPQLRALEASLAEAAGALERA
jgi:hypothetical protein